MFYQLEQEAWFKYKVSIRKSIFMQLILKTRRDNIRNMNEEQKNRHKALT